MRVNFDDKSFSYVDINRSALAKYSKKSFIESFEVSEDILQFYFEKNVEKVKKLDAEILKILKLRIKSFIAYNLFDNGVYLESYSGQDPFVKKALEILTKR